MRHLILFDLLTTNNILPQIYIKRKCDIYIKKLVPISERVSTFIIHFSLFTFNYFYSPSKVGSTPTFFTCTIGAYVSVEINLFSVSTPSTVVTL